MLSRVIDISESPSPPSRFLLCRKLEESKGRGLGMQLWNIATSNLKQNSFREVTLWVLDTNTVAIKFYERVGLAADGGKKHANIGDQDVLELRYRMRLE